MTIAKHPTTKEALLYHSASSFKSQITIGGAAPDGAALTLDGRRTSLHAAIDSSRPTILNFGSCT